MLIRPGENATFLISQPSHAWLAGQLARAWGNSDFAPPQPFEDFCFAAEQHDNGWLEWEERPQFDRRSGLPMEFWDVPATRHTALWRRGVRRMQTYGRFPALLVSLHADTIYQQTFDFDAASVENARAVRDFLSEQHALQRAILASLRADSAVRQFADDENIRRCKTLLLIVDQISLHLCWGIHGAATIAQAPCRGGARDLRLASTAHNKAISVDPWPFSSKMLRLHVEGKQVSSPFGTEAAMHEGLSRTDVERMEIILRQLTDP